MKNIFESKCAAIVITVNCEGVAGKGLALQCKKLYPIETQYYSRICSEGFLTPGNVLVVAASNRWLIFFPTKDRWKNPSKLDWIRSGMEALVSQCKALDIKSIAIPALGCNLGGLKWKDVKPIIEKYRSEFEEMELYEPREQ